ncbi:copper resistance protein CopC [Paeniglutamicibacter sp. NPDC091659]|uniref:copper resistance CopC family protein n=1 Tax=Paeniglutamicibacter sp. NPDC091659 TaxID=3364389 RepID=UPI0037F1A059
MPRQHGPSVPRAIRQSLTVVVLVAIALLAPVSAASAHDSLTGANPKDGQMVKEMPDVIDLTFSNMPLAIGTNVLVKDASGKDWAIGEVKIVDNVVSQSVGSDAPGGDYTVVWRVVSSDGHPIEGTFGFTANSGGAGVPSSPAAGPQSTADLFEVPELPASGQFPLGSVLGSVAVLLVLAAIIIRVARRRSDKNGSV